MLLEAKLILPNEQFFTEMLAKNFVFFREELRTEGNRTLLQLIMKAQITKGKGETMLICITMKCSYFVVLARNCLASTLDYIVIQMRKTDREKRDCNMEPLYIM